MKFDNNEGTPGGKRKQETEVKTKTLKPPKSKVHNEPRKSRYEKRDGPLSSKQDLTQNGDKRSQNSKVNHSLAEIEIGSFFLRALIIHC